MEQLTNLNFSNIWWAIALPVILMMLDIVTGYYNAWKNSEISSSRMRDGLGKKCAELCYIILGFVCKFAFEINAIMYFLVSYVCYMEIVSLFENCDKLGLKMPQKIKDKINNKQK